MRFKLIMILLLLGSNAIAQTQEDNFIKDLIESLTENLPEDYDLSELQDRLSYFKKHPINLNNTNPEILKSLFFISPLQISNLFSHIKSNGKLIDVLELQSIADFDVETIKRLLPFITVKESELVDVISLRNLNLFGENDLVIRFGSFLEKPKGYTILPGSRYLGNRDRFLFRYKYNYSNRISAALIFEKDAGEKFVKGDKQFLFDYQSAHIAIFNVGIFKKIVLGDYTLQFGQGLTLWSGFSFGKGPDVTSVAKRDIGLKPYTSANEYTFLRGISSTVLIAKVINFTPFISYRKLDANLSLNDNGDKVLTTINETGYHRTVNEIENKNSISQKLLGAAIQYQNNNLSIGAIAYHTIYSNAFVTGAQPYRYFNFKGKSLSNIGLNYNYTYKNVYFFGEVGKSISSGLASVNGALVSLSAKISAVILYRNYQKNYHNFFNQATAEGSQAFNENGLYVGLNIYPIKNWSIAFYTDYFKFPWLKFRVDGPSSGMEVLGQITYTPTKTFKAFLRYKTEMKQQNTDLAVPINYLDDIKKDSYRADLNWKLSRTFGFQHRFEIAKFKKGDATAEYGYMIYQDVNYSPNQSKISGNIRIAYFNTSSYNSRIYAYEDDVLYNFSFGMYNGKGFRNYLNLKYKITTGLDFWARYAMFLYQNTETVGNGLDEIKGNKKTDIKLQIRYQF